MGNGPKLVKQSEPLGTGHALMQSRSLLENSVEQILVVNGDHPLISGQTLRRMMEHHLATEAVMTLLTSQANDPTGMGRVIKNAEGQVTRIIEEEEATLEERGIPEICGGAYCFNGPWLWPRLDMLSTHRTREYYLTDLALEAASSGLKVEAVSPGDPRRSSWGQ